MQKKPGWIYSYIEILGQHIAVNNTTEVLYTEDKTMYTPEESRLLKKEELSAAKISSSGKKTVSRHAYSVIRLKKMSRVRYNNQIR